MIFKNLNNVGKCGVECSGISLFTQKTQIFHTENTEIFFFTQKTQIFFAQKEGIGVWFGMINMMALYVTPIACGLPTKIKAGSCRYRLV